MLLYVYWSKIVSGFGEPDSKPLLQILMNTSSGRKSTDFTNWASLGLVRPGPYHIRQLFGTLAAVRGANVSISNKVTVVIQTINNHLIQIPR